MIEPNEGENYDLQAGTLAALRERSSLKIRNLQGFRSRLRREEKTVAMSGIKLHYDLDDIELRTSNYCPYGFYAATLESVKTRYTPRGFQYLLLTFEVGFRDWEDEEDQVFHPTMVRWTKTKDGRIPVRMQKVLDAFECTEPRHMIHHVGDLVNIEIVKGDDFDWNGRKYMAARIKSVTPWTVIGPWPYKDSVSLRRKITTEGSADVN